MSALARLATLSVLLLAAAPLHAGDGALGSAKAKAAEAALAMAGLSADDIDAIIVATSTPDLAFPSAATMVQDKLGMTSGLPLTFRRSAPGLSLRWPTRMR